LAQDSGGGGSPDGTGNYNGAPQFFLADVGYKGVAYGPLYAAKQSCIVSYSDDCSTIFNDDISATWAKAMWTKSGRHDIANLAAMGANVVRTYGNDDRFSKREFLDELMQNKMKVVTGLSNVWYMDADQGCITKDFDCYDTIKQAYVDTLVVGEFVHDGYYHNAIEVINLMNEPNLNIGWYSACKNYLKAMLSALDGVLDAEKRVGVKAWINGTLPKFTATWSYADSSVPCHKPASCVDDQINVCGSDFFIKNPVPDSDECGPALTFVVQMYYVVQDPEGTIGYSPRNDLKAAFETRWVHSFNVFNQFSDIQRQFLTPFTKHPGLTGHKVFLAEYNPENYISASQTAGDIQKILDNSSHPALLGAAFFQYQVAYNKMGAERQWGLFELEPDTVMAKTGYIAGDKDKSHDINCLRLRDSEMAKAVATAYGGSLPTLALCGTASKGSALVV